LVCLDKSACNERIGDRKFGVALIGTPARIKRWLKRTERYSILPAYTIEGWMKPLAVKGAITAEVFEHWPEFDILPHCNRWDEDRNIIIIDNCSIYKSD